MRSSSFACAIRLACAYLTRGKILLMTPGKPAGDFGRLGIGQEGKASSQYVYVPLVLATGGLIQFPQGMPIVSFQE